jgi:Pentapeptide repeats (9 copies)/Pentapeptide repeats (8 copies)
MIQIQFLPNHSSLVAWTQRIALIFDLVLVWWLWPKVLSGGESDTTEPVASLNTIELGLPFSFMAIAFSCAIATFPGEWQEDLLAKWDRPKWTVTPHTVLFSAEPDRSTHRRLPFSNTLVLPGQNVYEGLGIAEPEKAKWRDFVFRPRGRDLRGAIFAFASLPRVDFYGANLRDARFSDAQLEGASFEWAQLQGSTLDEAQLEGASFERAQLEGASLNVARLQGANLFGAQLQGAFLQGAWLTHANLQGALLREAQLQGVSFANATLNATELRGTYLWRSNGIPATISAIDAFEDDKTWNPKWHEEPENLDDPVPPDLTWDETAYEKLRASLQTLPTAYLREAAPTKLRASLQSPPTGPCAMQH